MVRFVALGDSLTEGVGDPHPAYPNGLRGWAELVADALGARDPGADYVNLALRGRRAVQVLEEQVGVAVALQPTLVSLWAGGNDLLLPRVSVDAVADTLGSALVALSGTGAEVLLFTGFELEPSPVLRAARPRSAALNAAVRRLAGEHGATLVDVADLGRWGPDAFCPDRVHLNPWGHRLVAHRVSALLGLGPMPAGRREAAPPPRGMSPLWASEVAWWAHSVVPHVWRWATAAGSRERVDPKWAAPVPCAGRVAPPLVAG